MKYTIRIEINLPREKVVSLFLDPDKLHKWQPGFRSYERIAGEAGEVGARARLRYEMGGRDTEMIETVTEGALPEAYHAQYETDGVLNIQENYFNEIASETTEWVSVSEFRFSGFPMKLMGWLMPGAFKKQSEKFMENFKEFAESES